MITEPVTAKTSLILGGARSGKSRRAEQLVDHTTGLRPNRRKIYMATAQIDDDEMEARVGVHRARRDTTWTTVDVPLGLSEKLRNDVSGDDVVLIDCLTLWLSNLFSADLDIASETDKLIASIAVSPATLVFVSNEVGLAIVPDNTLARAFRDAQGVLNQKVAAAVEHVEFVAAGLSIQLKP